jgi:hypothetical protein
MIDGFNLLRLSFFKNIILIPIYLEIIIIIIIIIVAPSFHLSARRGPFSPSCLQVIFNSIFSSVKPSKLSDELMDQWWKILFDFRDKNLSEGPPKHLQKIQT